MKFLKLILLTFFLFVSNVLAQTELLPSSIKFTGTINNSNNYLYISSMTSNTTVYFTNTQTSAQMQTIINSFPKDLGTFTLIFKFYGCKYTNSTALTVDRFRNGILVMQGVVVAGPSASQSTIVTNSGGGHVFVFQNLDSSLTAGIDSIRCETAGPSYCIVFINTPGFNAVGNCYCWITGTTGAGIISTSFSHLLVYQSGFGGGGSGIYVNGGGRVIASNNSSLALPTPPQYGHYVDAGGILQRYDDLTIQSGADNYVSQGGLLITGAGAQKP